MDFQVESENEDIYEDLEKEVPMKNNSCSSREGDTFSAYSLSDLGMNELDITSIDKLSEAELREKEIKIFQKLKTLEEKEKREELTKKTELEKLKEELNTLKEADSSKNEKINKLLDEVANLKKNICSLYKTAKAEIEHKDFLLSEANAKLDKFLFRTKVSEFQYRHDRVRSTDSAKNESYEDFEQKGKKRFRDMLSPPSDKQHLDLSKKVSKAPSNCTSKSTVSRSELLTPPPSTRLKLNYENDKSSQDPESPTMSVQTPEMVLYSTNSRDATETNNVFFNLLPENLRQSFHEYEQNQIISLNKLKQSFVNEYFSCDTVPPPSLESTPKRPRIEWNKSMKKVENTPSTQASSIASHSGYNQRFNSIRSNSFRQRTIKRNFTFSSKVPKANQSRVVTPKKIDSVKRTKILQNNMQTLYSYRKLKASQLDNKKLKNLKHSQKQDSNEL